jgi:hypothetical protein
MELISKEKLLQEINEIGGYPYIDLVMVGICALVDRQPTINQWVSVEERLPAEDGRYLVVLHTKRNEEERVKTTMMRFLDGKWKYPHYVPEWLNNEITQTVTHWMPLPELPKQGKD